MKTMMITLAAALVATTTFAGNGDPEKGTTYTVDVDKSTVFWTGKKVTGEHTGTLMLKGGTMQVENGIPLSGSFDLDYASIIVTDITDEETNAKLVGHLKSEDFFHVEKFPVGKFEAKSFTPIAGAKDREPNYTVKGTLTIKGTSESIEFPVFVSTKGNALVANGKATFDRTKYDIKYGSGSFFEGLGDKVIYDDVELTIVLSAKSE